MNAGPIDAQDVKLALQKVAPGRFSRIEGLGVRMPSPDEIASPLPISTVLALIESARMRPDAAVLIAGMHSAFLVEVVARLVDTVHVVEFSEEAAERLRRHLISESISNVHVRHGRALDAWDSEGPFHSIIADGANRRATASLRKQIAIGGRLVTLTRAGRTGRVDYEHRTKSGELRTRRLGNIRTHSTLLELLDSMRVLPDGSLEEFASLGDSARIADALRADQLIEESDLVVALALHHGLGYASVEALVQDLDVRVARSLPRKFLEHHGILPLKFVDDHVVVAITDPDTDLGDIAQALQPNHLAAYLVSQTDYRRLWMAVSLAESGDDPSEADEPRAEPESTVSADVVVLDESEPSDVPRGVEDQSWMLFESLILESVTRRASDIHVEHSRSEPQIRLRIDGSLYPYERRFDTHDLIRLVNVFKVQASMDIAERRMPQGGAFHVRINHRHFDLRIQTQPTLSGENAVVRILPRKSTIQRIEDLGFSAETARHYRRALENPSGIVLVVGPTGSGKSTTLYSGLRLLAQDGTRKIVTIEDPIEHSVSGVQQSQVNHAAGFGFAEAVRSFLRLDPDVILIGEIRDPDTAQQAIRASRTGHLVLATLHCNETTDVIQRLADLGQDPSGLASELQGVLAQRLARRICPSCSIEAAPDPELVEQILPGTSGNEITCFRGRGCSRCHGTGTLGRSAVVEFLPVEDDLRDAISMGKATAELRKIALRGSMITLRERALELVREGVIALTDLPRILAFHRLAPER